jgi:SPOR domain
MKNDYDAEYDPEQIIGSSGNGGLRWMSMLIMVLVVFGFFSLVWYAYNASISEQQDENVAVISPENEEYKEKPEDAGGMEIANKDIEAYQLMRRQPTAQEEVEKVERLLPEAETPVILPKEKAPDPVRDAEVEKIDSAEVGMTTLSQKETNPVSAESSVKVEEVPVAGVVEESPKTIEKAVDTAIGTIVSSEPKTEFLASPKTLVTPSLPAVNKETITPKPSSPAPVTPVQPMGSVVKQPVAVKPAPVVPSTPQPTVSAMPKPTLPSPAAPVVVSPPQMLKLPPAVTPPVAEPAQPVSATAAVASPSGSAYVQLGALRSAAEAEKLWAKLREAHPDLLGNASRSVESVSVAGTGTLYRLRARGFASRASALSVCSSLKGRGQDCLVAQ